jgi:hypothetical protein
MLKPKPEPYYLIPFFYNIDDSGVTQIKPSFEKTIHENHNIQKTPHRTSYTIHAVFTSYIKLRTSYIKLNCTLIRLSFRISYFIFRIFSYTNSPSNNQIFSFGASLRFASLEYPIKRIEWTRNISGRLQEN